jgi:hypothetical protein
MALGRDGEVCSAQRADSETGERSSRPAEDEAVIAFWKSTLVGSKRKQSNEQKPLKRGRGRPKKQCLTLQECLSSLVETSEKVSLQGTPSLQAQQIPFRLIPSRNNTSVSAQNAF